MRKGDHDGRSREIATGLLSILLDAELVEHTVHNLVDVESVASSRGEELNEELRPVTKPSPSLVNCSMESTSVSSWDRRASRKDVASRHASSLPVIV